MFCGTNQKMVTGLSLYAEGLYEQAERRAIETGVPLDKSYNTEIKETNTSLLELDRKYYEELRPMFGTEEGIKKLFEEGRKKMPLCGVNPKMMEGLALFAQGLYEQAEKRAFDDKISLKESYKREINEMDILLSELNKKRSQA